MGKFYRLIVLILAVYRLSRMIAIEDGPADIFTKFRSTLSQESWVGRGFYCVLCLSFWLSLLAAILAYRKPRCILVHWLAIAGGVTLINEVT